MLFEQCVQFPIHVPQGSEVSRSQSGILTPDTDRDISPGRATDLSHSGDSSPGRKRKHAEDEGTIRSAEVDLFNPSIVIKPHPTNLKVKPRVLQPLMILPREHLALSHLDLASPTGDLCPGRFVESRIRVLDLENRMEPRPIVLIAKSESTGTCYAIECHEGNLYTACKLGTWVELRVLQNKATAVSKRLLLPEMGRRAEVPVATAAAVTPAMHRAQKKKKVAILEFQSLVKKNSRSRSDSVSTQGCVAGTLNSTEAESRPQTAKSDAGESQVETQPSPSKPAEVPSAPLEAREILENIRAQYFDTLYRSMGSLAYFAKGSLSRARAASHLDSDANLDTNQLVDFLKGLVLTTGQIDKKYRESIPRIITGMGKYVDSSEEDRRSKRRKSQKMRVKKNGMYPVEENFVRRWWTVNAPELRDDETDVPVEAIGGRVSLLRTRETMLQMILIMEILTLEPLCSSARNEEDLPGVAPSTETPTPAPTPRAKKRSKQSFLLMLDVHADRLLIWHTTLLEPLALIKDSEGGPEEPSNASNLTSSPEPLQDFCVDVILPFYAARHPEKFEPLNRKLGGPTLVSGEKPKPQQAAPGAAKPLAKPGSATKRHLRSFRDKPAQSLERALSREKQARRGVSNGPPTALQLMRSATATAIPTLKRDGSVPTLQRAASASVPLLGLLPRTAAPALPRGMALFSKNKSDTSPDEARRKKLTATEAELRDAISSVRKPNREKLSNDMAPTEMRLHDGLRSRAQERPARLNLDTSSIIIKATPARNRFIDVLGPAELANSGPRIYHDDAIPPSSISCVPGTDTRPRYRDAVLDTPCRDGVIADTPIRRPPQQAANTVPLSSPLAARYPGHANIPGTVEREPFTHVANHCIYETPVKHKSKTFVVGRRSSGGGGAGAEKHRSIYQKLGWDDDEIDELA